QKVQLLKPVMTIFKIGLFHRALGTLLGLQPRVNTHFSLYSLRVATKAWILLSDSGDSGSGLIVDESGQ
ncbi:MAG: hypothetical protein ACI8SI_001198, partial [Congregibacter sp.]